MATRIVFDHPSGSGTHNVLVSEEFDAVFDDLKIALGNGERFISVTNAEGDDEGKRFTIPAAGIRSLRED